MKRARLSVTLAVVLVVAALPLYGKTDQKKTIQVDCTKGRSIQAALEDKAEDLIVEIRGICRENVVVSRDNVSIRGSDPALDGIQGTEGGETRGLSVIEVLRAKNVTIENIQASRGGFSGLEVNQSVDVTITNCRSFDNLGHGLAVHGTLFLNGSDLTITDNQRRGISAFDSVNVFCTRCEIDAGNDIGVFAVESATVSLRETSVAGSPALYALIGGAYIEAFDSTVISPSHSMLAWASGQIFFQGGTFSGPLVALDNSTVQVFESDQIENQAGFNHIDLDSTLELDRRSSLLGQLLVEDFSKAVVKGASTVGGDLICSSGSDVFCKDPGEISGGISGCASCVQPPPCAPTAGVEYVVSGGTDPEAGIFVDDILRVFVNGGLAAEVSQGGRCCAPAAPIRFVADTSDTLRVQAQDANNCYSLEALWLQKADGSCLTQLTPDVFGPDCGAEPPQQIFFDETFTLP